MQLANEESACGNSATKVVSCSLSTHKKSMRD